MRDPDAEIQVAQVYNVCILHELFVPIQYTQIHALSAILAAASSGCADSLNTPVGVCNETHLLAGLYYFMKGEFKEALSSFNKLSMIDYGPITAV